MSDRDSRAAQRDARRWDREWSAAVGALVEAELLLDEAVVELDRALQLEAAGDVAAREAYDVRVAEALREVEACRVDVDRAGARVDALEAEVPA